MVNFNLNGKQYDIDNFMSLENYAKIYKIKDSFNEEYFAAKILNLITGAPMDDLLKTDYEKISYLSAYILSLMPFEKNTKLVDRFEIDGIKYGFFPNWKDLTFAEFMDIDTIATKPIDELLDYLHILAAIMYRPIEHEISEHNFIIEEYDVKSMLTRSEIFKKKLDINVLLSAQFFFIKFVRRYFLYTLASSEMKMNFLTRIKILWRMRKVLAKVLFKKRTGGSLSSTELLETILQSTK